MSIWTPGLRSACCKRLSLMCVFVLLQLRISGGWSRGQRRRSWHLRPGWDGLSSMQLNAVVTKLSFLIYWRMCRRWFVSRWRRRLGGGGGGAWRRSILLYLPIAPVRAPICVPSANFWARRLSIRIGRLSIREPCGQSSAIGSGLSCGATWLG